VTLEEGQEDAREVHAQLKPGLLADARIHIERRTILGLLMKPLTRLGNSVETSM